MARYSSARIRTEGIPDDAVPSAQLKLVWSADTPDTPVAQESAAAPHIVVFQRGYMRFMAGQSRKALALFRDAINIEPNFAEAYCNLGVLLADTGQLPAAIAAFRKAIDIRPDYADIYYNHGIALARTGQLPEALTAFRKAIEIKPDYADAHYGLGGVLARTGQFPDALTVFRKAIEIRPDDPDAHYGLGYALTRTGQHPDAIVAFRKAIDGKPSYAAAYAGLGAALAGTGHLLDAIAAYRKVLEIKPDYAGVYYNLGIALANTDQFPEAIAAYYRAVEINPVDADTHQSLGIALAKAGKLPDAIAAFRKAIEIRPDDSNAHYSLGFTLAESSQLPDAIVAYRRAIEIKPDFADAYYNLGGVLAETGQFQDAIAAYRKVVEFETDIKTWREIGVLIADCRKKEQKNKDGFGESDHYDTSSMPNIEDEDLAELLSLVRDVPAAQRPALKQVLLDFRVAKAAARVVTRRAKAVRRAQREATPPGGDDLKLSLEQVAAVIADSTLGRLQTRYEKLLTTRLPASGLKDVKQARLAAKLSTTFDNLQTRRKELGLPPLPKDAKVTEARRLSSAFYRKERAKEPTRSAPRSRGSTARFAA